jgi:hypothetical protein
LEDLYRLRVDEHGRVVRVPVTLPLERTR